MDINQLIDIVDAHDELSASLFEDQFRRVDAEQASVSMNEQLLDVE